MDDLEKWKHKNPLWYLILKYPKRNWNWQIISYNPNITWDIIQANPEKSWDWQRISKNPNITVKLIEANLNKINFASLSKNKFTFMRKQNQQKQFKLVLFTLQNFLPQQLQRTIVMDYFYQEIK